MALTVPTTEPTALRAGDTWRWRREDLADYPPAEWTLTYHFRNAAAHFDLTASADGDAYAVTVSPVTSIAITPGTYDWYAFATKTEDDVVVDRAEVASGRIEIRPNVGAAAAFDGRTWARRMLDATERALEGRATRDELDMIHVQLQGRGLTRTEAGLRTWLSWLRSEVRREELAASGRRVNPRLVVRF